MELGALSIARGISGQEGAVRELLQDGLEGDVMVDAMGNLLATKGKGRGLRVMLAAHMDEVGLMVSWFEKDGLLRFKTVGGMDPRILPAKAVLVGQEAVPGVIGAKPVHMQEEEARKKPYRIEDLFIDIGASSREEAERMVKLGDQCTFGTAYSETEGGMIRAKALDDRAGCFLVRQVFSEEFDLELTAAFTVQEELGLRGAAVAAYSVNPEIALAIDVTSASDTPGTDLPWQSTSLGKGPAISLMDAAGVYSRKVAGRLAEVAQSEAIPFQYKRSTRGGTDAGRIQLAREGALAATLSVPARYIHCPASVMSREDLENTGRLLVAFLRSLEGGANL
jgi:endoglucanase